MANERSDAKKNGESGISGLINGLTGLLGALGDLAEKGEQLEQLKSLQSEDGRTRVESSFRVRTLSDAAGGNGRSAAPKPEPVNRPEKVKAAPVTEVREPQVDVFEEEDHVLVVVEMPGIPAGSARFQIDGDVLTVDGESGAKRYHGETLLPRAFESDAMTISANAGVFELRLAG